MDFLIDIIIELHSHINQAKSNSAQIQIHDNWKKMFLQTLRFPIFARLLPHLNLLKEFVNNEVELFILWYDNMIYQQKHVK